MTSVRTSSRSLSIEEEAELARSNKKVKDAHHANFCKRLNASEGPGRNLSFKEKLVGAIPGAFSQAFLFSNHMEAESDSNDELRNSGKVWLRLSSLGWINNGLEPLGLMLLL